MSSAGWADVWHLIVAIWWRQPPFVAILMATGAVFVAVMALEGMRTSLMSIWRAHRNSAAAPPPRAAEPVALAAPAPLAPAASKSFSVRSVSRAAPTNARKRKPLTVASRSFRSPRPTIRRHPTLEFAAEVVMPQFSADAAVLQHESV